MMVYREFENGWMLAMNDEAGKKVVPDSLFCFGRQFDGRPVIDFWQREGGSGLRGFLPHETENSVRAFLLDLGFTEVRRYDPQGDPELETIAPMLRSGR